MSRAFQVIGMYQVTGGIDGMLSDSFSCTELLLHSYGSVAPSFLEITHIIIKRQVETATWQLNEMPREEETDTVIPKIN